MLNTPPLAVFHKSFDKTVRWAILKLKQGGFQVVRTFDLQTARAAHLDYSCPKHGSTECNCQMVVLLVYLGDTSPETLVIHGNDQTSWFYIMKTPSQSAGLQLESTIQDMLSQEIDPS